MAASSSQCLMSSNTQLRKPPTILTGAKAELCAMRLTHFRCSTHHSSAPADPRNPVCSEDNAALGDCRRVDTRLCHQCSPTSTPDSYRNPSGQVGIQANCNSSASLPTVDCSAVGPAVVCMGVPLGLCKTDCRGLKCRWYMMWPTRARNYSIRPLLLPRSWTYSQFGPESTSLDLIC